MKKILRVHTYDPSTEDEQHYILRNLRRSVAAVAVDMGMEKLNSRTQLNTLSAAVSDYLLLLGAQTKTVCSMKKRLHANFVDVLHALELMDKQIYDELLQTDGPAAAAPPETSDNSVIERYGDVRLDRQRYVHAENVVGFTADGEPIDEQHMNSFEYVNCGTSFVEIVTGRAVSVLDKSKLLSGPLPVFKLDEIVINPKILLPISPDCLNNFQGIIKEHGHKKDIASDLNQPLFQALLHNAAVNQQSERPTMESKSSMDDQIDGLGPVGKIIKPYRFTAQSSLVKVLSEQFDTLLSDSDPYIFHIKSLPVNIPSHLEWWMPVYPLSDEVMPPAQTAKDKAAAALEHAAQMQRLSDQEKVELQIELCNIEPDFPTLQTPGRSTNDAAVINESSAG